MSSLLDFLVSRQRCFLELGARSSESLGAILREDGLWDPLENLAEEKEG